MSNDYDAITQYSGLGRFDASVAASAATRWRQTSRLLLSDFCEPSDALRHAKVSRPPARSPSG